MTTTRKAHNFSVLMLQNNLCTKNVSIERSIEDYRSQHPDKKPIILVDLMHIDQIKDGDPNARLRNICGPNLCLLGTIEKIFHFLKNDCQAELVFFVDGPDNTDLHQEFSEYQPDCKETRYARDITIIDALGNGDNYKESVRNFKHIPTDRILMSSIKSIAERYGTVWHSLRNSRSTEIAKYATEHGAMGVLDKNSKVLLLADLPQQLSLWYISELDCSTMTVTQLSTLSVKGDMRLGKKKRQLMMALLPGSFVGLQLDDIRPAFEVVKQLPNNIGEPQYRSVIEKLFPQDTATTWQQLQRSCELYDLKSVELSEQSEFAAASFVYDIVNSRTSTITVQLNDYRYWSDRAVDFHQLVVRFYGRLAGVVLKKAEDDKSPVERKIRIKRTHDMPFGYEMVPVEFPSEDILDGEGDYLARVAYILDLGGEVVKIRNLIERDTAQWRLLDYVTVLYLMKNYFISTALADCMLLAVELQSSGDKLLGQFPRDSLNMDAFHATFMYIRWHYFVWTALVASGVPAPLVDETIRLDGGLLQVLYQRFLDDPSSLNDLPCMSCVGRFGLHR